MACSRTLDKFLLLMWKNWLLQKRSPGQTLISILAPVLFSALLVLIRSLVDPTNHTEVTNFSPFDITKNVTITEKPFVSAAYSPNNTVLINPIMESALSSLNLAPAVFRDKKSLELHLKGNDTMSTTLCGIEFDDDLQNASEFPQNIKIKIRFPSESRGGSRGMTTLNWQTNFLFLLYQMAGPRNPYSNDGGYPPGYNAEKFLTIQDAVSRAIVENFGGDKSTKITMQRYPYPPYIEDPLLQALTAFIGIVIMLSFVYTCINTVKVITNEKETQVKEVMKIMGLPNWLHWLAWFVKSFMFLLISIILIVILLKVHWLPGADVSVFTNSDAFVIFVFLMLYMCSTITFCFMISSFFSRANTAATIAGLFWFVSYTPYIFLQPHYDQLGISDKFALCLGSNSAMGLGFQFMLMYEGTGEGVQWHNIWKPVTPDDTFVLGHIMLMLVVDAIIYLLITLYVEAIIPGDYGVPKPWYFPFTKSFWCGASKYSSVEDIQQNGKIENKDVYEQEPSNMYAGIQIKHLRKLFRNKKVAVRNLCLNLYEDQITALLGHNGAGKTTTMSMLTGIYPPTSGTAIIGGHDICTEMSGVRDSLGLCPQHNIIFDDLTVNEHLYFYSKLKGLNKDEIDAEINKYVTILDLMSKTKARAGTLSGGMKRKLSVGIALCGNSKIVMLDEPTAGMDPAARRHMWDLLQAEKKGRTILLSTHFMDEADLLGDRIAIMAGGTLQCCGSSFFLKKRYGAGYHLTLEKSPQCNVLRITELLRTHIPNIQVENNVGSELSYRLSESQLPVFESMLRDLEEKGELLGVMNYGISLTTLEEVFMRVGADHGQEEEQDALEMNGTNIINDAQGDMEFHRHSSQSKLDLGDHFLTGFKLYKNQFRAMIMKKVYTSLRAWVLNFIQLLLPMIFLILAIVTVRSMKTNYDLPALTIGLSSYDRPTSVMNIEDGDANLAKNYKEYISGSGHLIADLQNGNITNYILEKYEENVPEVRQRHIVGASFLKDEIRAWFNNEPLHATPLAINTIHNTLLRKQVGDKHNITIINHPLPYTMDTKFKQIADGNNIGFQIAFNIGFSMAFVSSFYILFCIRERVCKAKHLQFVSGANVLIFWISAYIWDFLHFTITALFLVATLAAFQEDGFKTFDELGRIFSVLILFGHAMLPLIYLASFRFDIPASGYTRMTFINIFTGVAGFLVVEILKTPSLDLKHIADILDWIFLLIPHYGVSTGIHNLHTINSKQQLCNLYTTELGDAHRQMVCLIKKECCSTEVNYYSWEAPGIGRNMFFFSIVGVILFCLLIIIEYRIPNRIRYAIKNEKASLPPDAADEDDDVANERHKINNATSQEINSQCLVLQDLSKYYKSFLAVNKLSVGAKRSECFGLLGVNGAGKTSTFKMLTGDENISYGDAWVNGLSLKTDMKKVQRVIGYCPQFDALIDTLTGRETLLLFCLLRGVSYKESMYLTDKLATEFDFRRHIDKKVKEYSGGNKRKLSTAVALIGDPYVVYLDEPSTGMDPAAKRNLWNALCKVRDNGKCIVLTSHSMEECEALCTRLAIMVNGTFKCLGSTQHLKSKFSEGYTLTVKITKQENTEIQQSDIDPIERYIREHFPSAILRERYQELLTYYIPDRKMPWSKMFGLMEAGKAFLNIEDYSLGQSSLEQVFLSFTRHQREE